MKFLKIYTKTNILRKNQIKLLLFFCFLPTWSLFVQFRVSQIIEVNFQTEKSVWDTPEWL